MDMSSDKKLNRKAITTNGKAAFYACIWPEVRKKAMELGWAAALHGSLATDMDVMVMPWIEDAQPFFVLVKSIASLFPDNDLAESYRITYDEEPHGRVVATIPIWTDFYLDISTMTTLSKEAPTHACLYCGKPAEGPDDDVLCLGCQEVFGHFRFSHL